jgi:hypothetical protein
MGLKVYLGMRFAVYQGLLRCNASRCQAKSIPRICGVITRYYGIRCHKKHQVFRHYTVPRNKADRIPRYEYVAGLGQRMRLTVCKGMKLARH